jgi:hypothetical protein
MKLFVSLVMTAMFFCSVQTMDTMGPLTEEQAKNQARAFFQEILAIEVARGAEFKGKDFEDRPSALESLFVQWGYNELSQKLT